MIWVISTGEAFWQHNISRHPKHLLQHLTVIYSSFISPSLGALCSGKRRADCVCVCVCVCVRLCAVYILAHGGLQFQYTGVPIWVTKMYLRQGGSQLGNEIMIDIPFGRD